MSDQWYYVQGGESRGPHSLRELKGLAQAGKLKSNTLVWKEGMEDWVAAGESGLMNGPPPVKPPPPPQAPLPPVSKSAPVLPPPPARFTTPPPRAASRPVPPPSQQTGIIIAASVALIAGLAIGWLAHAMLVSPRDKQVAAVATPAPKVTSPARSQPANGEAPKALPSAAPLAQPLNPVTSPAATLPPATLPPAAGLAVPGVTTPAEPPPSPPTPAAASGTTPALGPTTTSPAPPVTPSSGSSSSQSSQSQYKPKTTLYQEIDVQRASKMPILETISQSHYQFLSQIDVSDPDAEGIRTVGQSVLDTRLLKADELSQGQLEESLKKLKGWQFSYTLSKDGEVLKMMAGPADAPVAGKVAPKGAEGFIVTSVMDEAGWKELAQISFYVPDEQASGNKRHLRQMTHDFGPLGSFTGETTFVRKGMQKGLLQIDYSHKLAYRAPGKGAAIGGSPITVSGADLRPEIAGGSIWYDQKAKRVRQAEDNFYVKGEIATNLAALPVEEQQAMIVKLTDVNPWSK